MIILVKVILLCGNNTWDLPSWLEQGCLEGESIKIDDWKGGHLEVR